MLNTSDLSINDGPVISWVLVQDAVNLLWDENPKLHDIGALVQAIERYGFQELPKFDKQLRNRAGERGGIKSGNGRLEAVAIMERDKKELPRGLAVTKDGKWAIPILTGTDGKTELEAKAYAIDANNLTMAGGDFTAYDVARMWGEEYIEQLKGLAEADNLPVSVDGNILDALMVQEEIFKRPDFETIVEEFQQNTVSKQKGDEKWLYVEFYGDDTSWKEATDLLLGNMVDKSMHEINGKFFLDAIRAYVNKNG